MVYLITFFCSKYLDQYLPIKKSIYFYYCTTLLLIINNKDSSRGSRDRGMGRGMAGAWTYGQGKG
jgi:hypothetical protein